MTSPAKKIKVECPECGRLFEDWHRASINFDLEGWDADDPKVQAYLRECSTATCPDCGHVANLGLLVVSRGVWQIQPRR